MKADLKERKKENKERKIQRIFKDLEDELGDFIKATEALGTILRGGSVLPVLTNPQDFTAMSIEGSGERGQVFLYTKVAEDARKEIINLFEQLLKLNTRGNKKVNKDSLKEKLKKKLIQLEGAVDLVADLEVRHPSYAITDNDGSGFYYEKGLDKVFSEILYYIGLKKPDLSSRKEMNRRRQEYPEIPQTIYIEIIELFNQILNN